MPDKIHFTAGHKNIYTYDAGGQKLRVVNYSSNKILDIPMGTITPLSSTPTDYIVLTTDYVGNMIYENGALKEILLPEGYYQNGTFYYYLKDHLGDNRVTINSSGAVVEKSHYYPSGTRFFTESTSNSTAIPYRYNGKELEAMNGLNQMDYGARRRFAGLPVWTGGDPLCEIKPWQSPYMYCSGNPINRTDPTGMDDGGIPDQNIKEVTVTGHDGSKDNSSSSSAQFIDDASRNIPQNLIITPTKPTFNLPINTTNQQANGNTTGPKDKELSATLKKITAQLYALGLTDASVKVIITSADGVPTISVLFKGGAAFANLASVASKLKGIVGPIGFGLNLFVDAGKVNNGEESKFKAGVNTAVGIVSLWVPEVGIVYMILDHYGAFDGPPTKITNYQQNSICPQDAIKTEIPNFIHKK